MAIIVFILLYIGINASQHDLTNDIELVQMYVERWATAFCARDGQTIIDLSSKEMIQSSQDEKLLVQGNDFVSFGMSSPWPMEEENAYKIINLDEQSATIYYYALTSEPHIFVMVENLEYQLNKQSFQVIKQELIYLNEIDNIAAFYQAYPEVLFTNTMMDYKTNGLGEILNKNALSNKSEFYSSLFFP